ncbi:PCYCGC motif-containing (lipo)protein [Paenibacillus sp. NEAU-GSW1]|uniref:PCYCGC motif-containing (lipo)protein n=1 Tax=Paenibacillus sp. NEAU-GSW1 TaxID=2682486 RepID=UPI0012E27B1E|nr:PCYCGC motif-containing (lipo)protein [Paenibacillus sp. NEAU-GSW1]MUT68538.1 hypothetical protein [Paenibacillus sp. NEAU-GSW1]
MMLLSACGDGGEENDHSNHNSGEIQSHDKTTHAANGDLQEKTASADVMPSFLANQPEDIRIVYQVAGKATDLLEWIPCYCGCGESAGHKSNLNCFIAEVQEDGSVVWDDHGTRCGVCLKIAAQSVQMKQDGKSTLEIRQWIDKNYAEGFAAPTDTKMPSA